MKTYVFDIDGTICSNTNGKYELASPYYERIDFINDLYKKGNTIKYFTARGTTTGIDWHDLTKKQLNEWGAFYHELILGKPQGDIYVDDKGFNCNNWKFPLESDLRGLGSERNNFIFKEVIFNHLEVINKILTNEEISEKLKKLTSLIRICLGRNGKIIFAGNGGSFADSQHLAAEFVCKFKKDRVPLPAIALGTNTSNLTAIGNDYGFDEIFSREFDAIANEEDILIAISTSGNSRNIIKLIEKSKSKGIKFFILTGATGGNLSNYPKNTIFVPSNETAIIQQFHILFGHIVCLNSELEYL